MQIFPVLGKSKSAPTAVGCRSFPEALCHPNLHCQGMSSWGGVSQGPLLVGCASRGPLHPPPAACAEERHCQTNALNRRWSPAKYNQAPRAHNKGNRALLLFCIKKPGTRLRNCCQWEETCVGCLCFTSLSPAAFPLFCFKQQLDLWLNPGWICVVCLLFAQSVPTLCNPVDCSRSGSSVHGISHVRILEWVVVSFSRGSSWPTDRTQVFC